MNRLVTLYTTATAGCLQVAWSDVFPHDPCPMIRQGPHAALTTSYRDAVHLRDDLTDRGYTAWVVA